MGDERGFNSRHPYKPHSRRAFIIDLRYLLLVIPDRQKRIVYPVDKARIAKDQTNNNVFMRIFMGIDFNFLNKALTPPAQLPFLNIQKFFLDPLTLEYFLSSVATVDHVIKCPGVFYAQRPCHT